MARGIQVFPANDASPRHLKSRDPTSWASIRQAVGETRCVETRIVETVNTEEKTQDSLGTPRPFRPFALVRRSSPHNLSHYYCSPATVPPPKGSSGPRILAGRFRGN
ncbi:hypothetical protein DTO207G8_8912 [Paecilomyces variotii]|nr:hypothetical protein DTO169E5_6293 [Paecilomyces variotii]KAJ9246481.1 hypothetical protein DTO207G8_8912 [Paecilomyces variotii]